jgi:hypothetical protein
MAVRIACAALAGYATLPPAEAPTPHDMRYRIEARSDAASLRRRFSNSQLALLEKLNRADVAHLPRLRALVVPESWTDELSYSLLPMRYPSADTWPTSLVIYLPGQLFGAYEFGRLVRWGPISSGSRTTPTAAGRFALNWRSIGRASTVNPDWFMRWYFNFGNRDGLAFHAYALPGRPASHGCIRLLERDAQWLFDWGRPWRLDASTLRILTPGTPVYIVGQYEFEAPPPWRSLTWLSATVELPSLTIEETTAPAP